MGAQVSIGDFSVMTSLSKKALRHYHDIGILEPAHIDAYSGYRFYDTSQVDHAHIIRRFRSLDMSIPDIKALLNTDDPTVRTQIITSHLEHMEHELQQTKDTVGALRELLSPTHTQARVELRRQPATPVWAISATIDIADIDSWFAKTMSQLCDALTRTGIEPIGPLGGLYERELFAESFGQATLFVPASHTARAPAMISVNTLPHAEVAVLTHSGTHQGIDRSYGILGSYVHEHLISHEGPIREHYVGAPPTDPTAFTATEICWPIFSTAPPPP
jgi:DNA-binding transcriptional MerR regulator